MATNAWLDLPLEGGGGGGGGVTSINALTGALFLVTGTSGTDFNVSSVGFTLTLNLPIASAVNTGKLSNTDWTTFNNKQSALTFGNLTDAGTDGITITGGTGAVIGSGTSISQHVADSTHNGYLSSTDWTTFNNKGSVTSVALALPVSVFSVSGSPVTSSGTLTGSFTTQTANTVFSGPTSGGAATPTFRALVSNDIPSLSSIYMDLTTNQTAAGNKTFSGQTSISNTSTTALSINTTSFVFDATNNVLGIGITPSTNAFIDGINSTGAAKRMVLTGYGSGSTVGFRGRFARGTSGSPTAAQNGDILNFISGQGYGTSQFPSTSTGLLNIVAGETFTNSSNLTYVTINTTPTGSVTSTENFRVSSTGVTIGPQSSSTAIHQISGGTQVTTRSISSALTIDTTTSDELIYADTSGGAFNITLPTPTNGRRIIIKDSTGNFNTNNVTLVRHGSEKIEGIAASRVLQAAWGSYTIYSNGTDWFLL